MCVSYWKLFLRARAANLEKPLIGKGGMASCVYDKKVKAWGCEVGDVKFKTKSLEIEAPYSPNAIGLVSNDFEKANFGEFYATGYALGKIECRTRTGKPDPRTKVYGRTICTIMPKSPKERKAYLEGHGK